MRRASSTSSTYSHVSDVSSSGDALRPTLSRASSTACSDDGSLSTPSFRTHHSSASASMEGIDLLGSSASAAALPLSGKRLPLLSCQGFQLTFTLHSHLNPPTL